MSSMTSSVFALSRRAALLGAVFLAVPAYANAQAIAPDAAKKFIENLGNRTVDVIKAASTAPERSAAFTRIMLDGLDFDTIGTMAIGKLARAATAEQKREYTPLFAAYVIDVAIARFGNLQIKSFGLGSAASQPNGDVKVHTRIVTGERPMEVYWRVRETGGGPKINDIEVEGASLAIHYRGEFERAGVATVPQVIARLKELTKGSTTVAMTQQAMK